MNTPNSDLWRAFEALASEYRRKAISEVPRARACDACKVLYAVDELHVCVPKVVPFKAA